MKNSAAPPPCCAVFIKDISNAVCLLTRMASDKKAFNVSIYEEKTGFFVLTEANIIYLGDYGSICVGASAYINEHFKPVCRDIPPSEAIKIFKEKIK